MTTEPVLVRDEPVRYDKAPNLADGLERYIEHGVPPGHFLTKVLENDLLGACERADSTNRRILFEFVFWLVNYAPSECWGSPEKVDAWLDKWTAAGHPAERKETA